MDGCDGTGIDTNTSRVTYTYPMVKETDMTESMKADVRHIVLALCYELVRMKQYCLQRLYIV